MCGYGALRRLTREEYGETLSFADKRFLTLFYPHTGLPGPLDWLPRLYGASLDPKNPAQAAASAQLDQATRVLNRLLPTDVQIEDVSG